MRARRCRTRCAAPAPAGAAPPATRSGNPGARSLGRGRFRGGMGWSPPKKWVASNGLPFLWEGVGSPPKKIIRGGVRVISLENPTSSGAHHSFQPAVFPT